MSVFVTAWLFGKPEWELGRGAVTPQELRELAGELRDRLQATADVVEKLTAADWVAQLILYDIHLAPPDLATKAEVEEQFRALGIDPATVSIEEEDDEEDFDEDDDDAG
jgi:hypothetical protein